ncbi:MAG TPA: prepilin peptidase [Gemmatimonadaceae bacterium]|nr:prepilin peptidase [Gemmatimonadaceae bacterium]
MLAVLYALVFLVGASIGSFLNVCIGRWPAGESVVRPPSRCPSCGHRIAWHENVPVLGWLFLRGRCAGCGGRISIQYPIVELVVGLGWLAAVWWFGLGFTGLRVAMFGTILLGIAITDLKYYLIPDGFTVFGLLWVIATALAAPFIESSALFAGPWDSLIGACVGAGAIAIAGWLGEAALKKEAMGFGDVTLMAMAGAALGPTRSLLTIFIGALLGAVAFLLVVYPVTAWRRRGTRPAAPVAALASPDGPATEEDEGPGMPLVPFGVFLAPAAMVTLLWGDALVRWYVGLIQGG